MYQILNYIKFSEHATPVIYTKKKYIQISDQNIFDTYIRISGWISVSRSQRLEHIL